ncbi:MAG: hypothetical protein JST54_23970 [Deltaproteobacteria bacterium]|nr:hypothetical protein [Deltaproteobacteria bacterium]
MVALYPQVDYSGLTAGVEFELLEGPHVVGTGRVLCGVAVKGVAMTEHERSTIRSSIHSDHRPGSQVLLELERIGEPAFDEISRAIREAGLRPLEQIRALRMLALLTRQACQSRRRDLLDLALSQMQSTDIRVRSAAANMAIGVTSIFRTLLPPLRESVKP